ncbi:MAG: glycosyltransferase family 39 protein [Bacteroidia bacterium]|nr:glycosyltransferase family 39 protein [Bacteroidia bacterium]
MKHLRPIIALLISFALVYLFLDNYYGVFHQAYLWDELGVYSRGAIRMSQEGLGLLPSALEDELSRGHPLLCPFYFGLAFKLFGCTPLVGHIAAVLINCTAFVFLYLIIARYMEQFFAWAATMAIFLQPMFLAQSLLILPETMLLLFTMMALYSYLNRNWIFLAISITLALFTKESALILPIAFLFAELVVSARSIKWRFLFTVIFVPIALLTVFFIIQKIQRGYYFYPLHTELAKFEWYFINERWQGFKDFSFYQQGHALVFFLFVAGIALSGFKLKDFRNALIILPLIVLGGIGFLVFNYYLSRYTLYFMLPYYLIVVLLVYRAARRNVSIALYVYLFIGLAGIYYWNGEERYTDVDFSYVPHIKNLQETLTELDQETYKDQSILMNFPLVACYWEKENGYKRKADYKIVLDTLQEVQYLVLTHPGNMGDSVLFKNKFKFHKHIGDVKTYSIIYKRIKQ